MTKVELAGYMASLLTLLEHQDKSGVHQRSFEIGEEYNRCWIELKETIRKEREDEARKSTDDSIRPQDRAEISRR